MSEVFPKDDASEPISRVAGRGDAVVLMKRGRRYVFPCQPGEESAVMDQLRQLASDGAHPLTWFDAAMLSHQLDRRLGCRLPQPPDAAAAETG
jgi:hypothetical protein